MSTHKHFNKICYAVLAVTLIITVLFMNGKTLGIPIMASGDESDDMFTANDLDSDWNTDNATKITLSDDNSTINGSGAYINDNDLYIACAGKYMISGTLSDSSIIINTEKGDKIWILLNGVSINCNDNAALLVEQADKVFITLANNTENTLSSGQEYNSQAVSAKTDGTIYSKDDLTINGEGALNVTAEYQHAIVCNDDLVITGGKLNIEAVQDGIHANDSIRIKNADITISAGDDGMTVSNDDETAYLYIESGNINIPSCYEGIEAVSITIAGGTIDITPTDDGINANGNGQNSGLTINGGDITIINTDGRDADGIDSNKNIYINGGNIFISVSDNGGSSAIDYGSENGGVCKINGGTVVACGSSSMAESFDSSSTQGFIMHTASAQADTTVSLTKSDGTELVSKVIPCSFSSIVVSTPEMEIGDTCTLTIGKNKEEITIDNTSAVAAFMPQNRQMNNTQSNNIGGDTNLDNSNPSFNSEEIPFNAGEMPADMPEPANGQEGTFPEKPNNRTFENGEQQPPYQNSETNEKEEQPFDISGDTDADTSQPDFSKDNNNFSDKRGGGKMADANENNPDTAQQNNALNKENIIYTAVSFAVIILGCIIALVFKKRK